MNYIDCRLAAFTEKDRKGEECPILVSLPDFHIKGGNTFIYHPPPSMARTTTRYFMITSAHHDDATRPRITLICTELPLSSAVRKS